MSEQQPARDFRALVDTLLRHKIVVIASMAVCVTLVLILDVFVRSPLYRSDVEVLIQNDAAELVAGQERSDAVRAMANELSVAQSRSVTDPIEAIHGDKIRISVETDDSRDVLLISATDQDPELAQQIARDYTRTYLDVREKAAVDDLLEAANAIDGRMREFDVRIEALGEPGPNTAEARDLELLLSQRALLTERRDQLSLSSDLTESGAGRIISAANLPDEAVSPNVLRDLILASALGLIVGLVLAYVRGLLTDSIDLERHIDQVLDGVPTFAELPVQKSEPGLAVLYQPTSVFSEAVRGLRTSVRFITPTNSVLQVVSAMPNDGKTTVSANLAYALAADGQNVLLIDGDLRNRGLSEMMGLDNGNRGLATILADDDDLTVVSGWEDAESGVVFIPAGRPAHGAAELLGGKRLATLLQRSRNHFDVVIVDSAPLVPVTDGALVAKEADVIVLVVGRATPPHEVARARRTLKNVERDIRGTVLNRGDGANAYGYGYRYGHEVDAPSRAADAPKPHEVRERFELIDIHLEPATVDGLEHTMAAEAAPDDDRRPPVGLKDSGAKPARTRSKVSNGSAPELAKKPVRFERANKSGDTRREMPAANGKTPPISTPSKTSTQKTTAPNKTKKKQSTRAKSPGTAAQTPSAARRDRP